MIAVSGADGVGRWLHPPVRGGGVCWGVFYGLFCCLAGFSVLFRCCFGTV
jgi:hypothetical protein